MTSIVESTRRNHALEHATMTVLAQHYKGVRMMGHSNPGGFVLLADLPTEIVTDAVLEAQHRLEAGESDLAVHPNCGTNLAVASLAGGAVYFLVLELLTKKDRSSWWKWFIALLAAFPAFVIARPLGLKVQRVITTEPDLGGLSVRQVTSQKTGNSFIHVIRTGTD